MKVKSIEWNDQTAEGFINEIHVVSVLDDGVYLEIWFPVFLISFRFGHIDKVTYEGAKEHVQPIFDKMILEFIENN